MVTVEGLCFSCHDHVTFQMIGQTPNWNPQVVAQKYLEAYQAKGKPIVACDLCIRRVRYELNGEGKWQEVELPW